MDNITIELAKYRLQQAHQCLVSSRVPLEIDDYKGAVNRSYYCIFHCMRSVLALESKDFSKHSGVSAYFRKEYIKNGIFDVKMSDIISEAFDMRSDSDYDDFYIISKDEVKEQIENAKYFYNQVSDYIIKSIT